MFGLKQQEFGRTRSCSKKEVANATTCIDCSRLFVIDSFGTQSFHYKIVSQPTIEPESSSRVAQVNPFNIMVNSWVNYAFLPPLLSHERMYVNHHIYNDLIEFLEKHSLGWTKDMSSIVGKRFVEGISKALF